VSKSADCSDLYLTSLVGPLVPLFRLLAAMFSTVSISTLQEEKLLLHAIADTFGSNLAAGAATAWLIYDVVITIDQEVAYVWKARWTYYKVLYLVMRYYMLLCLIINISVTTSVQIPFSICRHWFWFITYSGSVASTTLGEFMFLLRIYAAYGRSKKMLLFLLSFWLAMVITACTVTALEVSSVTVSPRPPGYPLPGCVISMPEHIRITLISWILSLSISATFFALILRHFLQSMVMRNVLKASGPRGVWKFRRIAPVVFLFIRDGTFYFLMVTTVIFINFLFVVFLGDEPASEAGIAWVMATYAIASSRLYLNLHGCINQIDVATDFIDGIEMHEISIHQGNGQRF